MSARSSIGLAATLAFGCAGCVVAPPPPPPYVAAPPPATAQAEAPRQNCREFRQTITVGGETKEGWGTTCQQSDGRWKVVTPSDAAPAPAPAAQVAAAPAYAYPYAYPAYPYYYPPPITGSVFIGGRWRWR